MATERNETTITEHEAGQVQRANASGLTPVVFVHGLWLLPSRWDKDVTEITEMPNRGHALTIDSGWREVAETALAFVQRFAPPKQ